MVYDLGKEPWKLKAMHPYVPLQGNSMETGQELRGITPWINCTVPGGVAAALYRAGWIEHPYFEENSLKCEWIENKWWVYETHFQRPALTGMKYRLEFGGVDYEAMVYLNNVLLGSHVGMYEAFSFDVTEQLTRCEEFTLRVLVKHAPDEMGQIGRTSETFTQKSRFNYKWDFSTRLVNLGVWKPVRLVAEGEFRLDDLSVQSDVTDGGEGLFHIGGAVRANTDGEAALSVAVDCSLKGETCARTELPVRDGRFDGTVALAHPRLWYPNGCGEQPLYEIRLTLLMDGRAVEERCFRQGIRRLRYLQNDGAPEGALPYTFEVNGTKVYIKGVNMTPLDHIYGDIPRSQYERTLCAARGMNVNLIRVWGGGIIESEDFYELCDRYGILVWQEFIQSSSGIDNIPSKRADFLGLLAATARCAVREKRNHTCLAVWSGGNELMDADGVPSTCEDENIAMLKGIVEELDPGRLFLPTSASGPTEWQRAEPGVSHDVHGDWQYRGNPRHYESYANADNLFHSEFGCDGMTNPASIPRIFSEAHRALVSMEVDDIWRFHGDWWDTLRRDTELFGPMTDLDEFISASQWIQAEGLRYILEANRRRQFHNSGSIIWQFNEPWPNVSCTCLYTYHGDPKMAYYWVKDAFAPLHASLDYRRLDYAPGSEFLAQAWLHADAVVPAGEAQVRCQVLTAGGRVLHEEAHRLALPENGSVRCFPVRFTVPGEALFFVRLSVEHEGLPCESCYLFSTVQERVYAPARALPAPELRAEEIGRGEGLVELRVTNVGQCAALHVQAVEETGCWQALADRGCFTLFPGESRVVKLTLTAKEPFGFGEFAKAPGEPVIRVRAFRLRQPLPLEPR